MQCPRGSASLRSAWGCSICPDAPAHSASIRASPSDAPVQTLPVRRHLGMRFLEGMSGLPVVPPISPGVALADAAGASRCGGSTSAHRVNGVGSAGRRASRKGLQRSVPFGAGAPRGCSSTASPGGCEMEKCRGGAQPTTAFLFFPPWLILKAGAAQSNAVGGLFDTTGCC